MPANLTPVYQKAEERFKEATTTDEKIDALLEMLAVIPKHKGTEHMRAELRRRLSKLREEAQQGGKGSGAREALHRVERQGAGQVVLVGAPNTGGALINGMYRNSPAYRAGLRPGDVIVSFNVVLPYLFSTSASLALASETLTCGPPAAASRFRMLLLEVSCAPSPFLEIAFC